MADKSSVRVMEQLKPELKEQNLELYEKHFGKGATPGLIKHDEHITGMIDRERKALHKTWKSIHDKV